MKLDEYILLSEAKTVSGRFLIDWTKTFEKLKIPHRKQDCLDCDNGKYCSDCAIKCKMNCFNCELERACKSCLDLISRNKSYSTDINMLKRKPANENYQMLPYYASEYKPKQNNIDFESAREILMNENYEIVVKRRFERVCYKKECKLYMKKEDKPENKEIFNYGFKHIKTDNFDSYILFGCESDELFESDILFNFWSNKFKNTEIEKRKFRKTGWSFLTLLKGKNLFKIKSNVCS